MDQAQQARMIFESLLRVFSIFRLYPKNNQNRQQSVAKFYDDLAAFLNENGSLAFEIQKKEVRYFGEPIYTESGRAGDFIFLLYRDGLQWLEFLEGVTPGELERLLEILDEYCRPGPPATEDDLIARLGEEDLPNMVFQDSLDLDDFLVQVGQGDDTRSLLKMKSIEEVSRYLLALSEDPAIRNLPPFDPSQQELSAGEKTVLERMEAEDDQLSPLSRLFYVLAYVFDHEEEEELLVSILDLLRERISAALQSRNLETARRILANLQTVSEGRGEGHWSWKQREQFLRALSDPEFLDPLNGYLTDREEVPLREVESFLETLHPEAVQVLAPLALNVWSPEVREVLLRAVIVLAARDLEQVARLSEGAGENLLLLLIDVLGKVCDEKATEALLPFLDDPSPRVVAYALKTIRDSGAWFPHRVFRLIDHPAENVRQAALEYLGSRRCEKAESLLIDYLGSQRFGSADKAFALHCFRALGGCGGSSASAFFASLLSQKRRNVRMPRSVQREGAVLGLQTMGTEEAEKVLGNVSLSGSCGIRPSIAQGFRRMYERLFASAESRT